MKMKGGEEAKGEEEEKEVLFMLFKCKIMDQEEQEVLCSISQSAAASNLDVKTRKFNISCCSCSLFLISHIH